MQMQIRNLKYRDVYSEVFEILSYMDKKTVMKIPMVVLCKIKKEKNNNYISRIDKNNIFVRENVLPETINYFSWLYRNYWIND